MFDQFLSWIFLRWRVFRISVVVLLALSTLASQEARAQPRLAEFPFHHAGQFIVDASGRVVLFHGVNLVNKFPPYAPSAAGFQEVDAKLMADAGWNVVRLGVLQSGVEPSPGHYDEAYLDRIEKSVALLGRHGIFSLLDFHQDIYGPVFTGDGLPPWATLTDNLPLKPSHGFPNDYFELPALQRAFDHFWKNSQGPGQVGLQDRYAAACGRVAQRFASNRWVMGYDLFNEPFPGSNWRACNYTEGCVDFDRALGAFMEKTAKAIATIDSTHMIFYEPVVLFDFGIPTNLPGLPGDRVGMSFHDYWAKNFNLPIQNALSHSRKTQAALFMTEFGASVDPAPVIKVANLADSSFLPWIYWAYANKTPFKIVSPGFLPATPEQQGVVLDLLKPREGANLNHPILQALTRPYPVAIAGTPTNFGFDPATQIFRLEYRMSGVDSTLRSQETVIVLPTSLYPKGYRVDVSGAKVTSSKGAKLLQLLAEGQKNKVTVSVSPIQ
jgi:endoglycosylceramidase